MIEEEFPKMEKKGYYRNGVRSAHFKFKNLKPVGHQRGWYSNGAKRFEGHFDENGLEHGHYRKYDKEGNLLQELEYVHGQAK